MTSEAINQKFLHIPKPALVASVLLHLLFPVGWGTLKVLDYFGIKLFDKKPHTQQMYQEFIQVDMVGLPQNLVKDLPSVDATAPIVENAKTAEEKKEEAEAAKNDEMQALELKKKEEAAAAAAKAESVKKKEAAEKEKTEKEKEKALKKLAEEASREAALKALAKKDGKTGRQKISGNLLSKGTSATGMVGTARDRYVSLVAQKIKEHFNVFAWQRKKNLVTVVTILIYPTGRVKEKRVDKPSSDPLFDSAVLQAIEDAQPLPVPEDMSIVSNGIDVEFRP